MLCSRRCLNQSPVTFTHADGAALPVLSIAVAAVLVAGEGGTLDAATHLTAVLVPPEGTTITDTIEAHTHIKKKIKYLEQCPSCAVQMKTGPHRGYLRDKRGEHRGVCD